MRESKIYASNQAKADEIASYIEGASYAGVDELGLFAGQFEGIDPKESEENLVESVKRAAIKKLRRSA